MSHHLRAFLPWRSRLVLQFKAEVGLDTDLFGRGNTCRGNTEPPAVYDVHENHALDYDDGHVRCWSSVYDEVV